ncbi:MAG: ATP-binding cassette domain-containing protein [Clostridiales bacterium]|nr:ATP-binding cassette domain-containing protein [Clostridiales bacterium]
MLKINNLSVNYGGIKAVRDISFEVPDGEIVTLIGANGAGKSTTLRAIAGLVKPAGGEQQMLAVGRALMSRPKLMMMDEPSLGLAPLVVKDIFGIIREINKQGVTILLVEQNANMALHTANIGYVLETGRVTLKGSGQELLDNEAVRKAYLGEAAKATA